MIYNIENMYHTMCQTPSDINEHLPTLKKYGDKCTHITEMGVRGICSTWAFLSARPKKMISYDIQDPARWGGDINSVIDTAKFYNINYTFILENVLNIEIENTDLLFLDTWHSYKQLKQELLLHANNVNKYIVIHDTITFAYRDEEGYESFGPEWVGDNKGILVAIKEFLKYNTTWEQIENFTNNNGLMIIGKR